MITSQKLNLGNYGIAWQSQKEKDENESVGAKWWGDIST